MPVHVFVGPTLAARDVVTAVPGAIVHPPVAHGDLLRLGLDRGDTAVIIDGYFHQRPSLRHKEILWMLARQVHVVGCSSLGALRAAELAPYGLVGNGVVFEMYRDSIVDADDEVAVAHGEGPEYRKFGIPLVSLRHAAAMAQQEGVVTGPEAAVVVAAGRGLHYTVRSWRAVEAAVARDHAAHADAVDRVRGFLAARPAYADVKAADAIDTLLRLDELRGHDGDRDREWIDSPSWKNRLLHEWRAEFTGMPVDGIHIGHRAVMQFQRIYRRDFPVRWSRFALRGIAAGAKSTPAGSPDTDLETRALAVSAEHGVNQSRLTAAQRAEWLTTHEIAELTSVDALLRILVRSYRPPRGIFDLVTAETDLVTDPAARTAVAESEVVNAEIAGWSPGQGIEYLKLDILRQHLRMIWDVSDERSLLAAARDRGFESVAESVDAVRPFFLRRNLAVLDSAPRAGEPG